MLSQRGVVCVCEVGLGLLLPFCYFEGNQQVEKKRNTKERTNGQLVETTGSIGYFTPAP